MDRLARSLDGDVLVNGIGEPRQDDQSGVSDDGRKVALG
jgi:hypothetical protein